MLRLNLKYGSATAMTGIISSALLAWCIPHLSFVYGSVLPFDDRFYMRASLSWQMWRADILMLIASAAAGFFRKRKKRTAVTFFRYQILPIAAIMALSALIHFILIGETGFTGGVWVSLAAALLVGQFMTLIDNLCGMDLRPAPVTQ